MNFPVLALILFTLLLRAVLVWLIPREKEDVIRGTATCRT